MLALAALLLVAVGVAWSERVALVAWAATRLLEQRGLGPAALVVDAVDLHGFRAHDVTLRGGALRIGAVTVAYDPLALIAAHVDRVDLAGFDLALAIGGDGVTLGGKSLGGGGGSTALPGLRLDTIALSDMRLTLSSDAGAVEATLSATLALGAGAITARDVAAVIAAPVAGTRRTAHVTARRVSLAPGVAGSPLLAVVQATVTPDELPWTATGIDGTVTASGDRLTAQLSLARLADLQEPALVAPLRLAAEASLGGETAEITFHAATVAPSPFGLDANVRYDRSSSTGAATLTMAPLVFHAGTFQPRDLFPVTAGLAEEVEGSVGLTGSIGWRQGELSPKLVLRLDDLAFATDAAQIRALTGAVALDRLWPPATPPGQRFAASIEAPGLPPAKLSLQGQLTAKPSLRLERLALEIAGGAIAAAPFTVEPVALAIDTVLAVDHVDLAEVTKLLRIDGLGGTGLLDGRIPLRLGEGKLTIAGGHLAARAPGTLRYHPEKLPGEIAAAGDAVDLALRALADFRYDRLSLDLDKSAEGEGTVMLRLQGNNPAVLSGHPFNVNIRVDSNFDRLAELALLSLRSAQDLLRRAAAGRTGP
jgi:Dicarboxylate transport